MSQTETMWQPKNRTFKQSMLVFNTAWGSTLSNLIANYKITVQLENPVGEIPSQLMRPIHDRFKKNIIEESPAVSTEIGLNKQKGSFYYTKQALNNKNLYLEHPLTSVGMNNAVCSGKVSFMDYMFQPIVRMVTQEDKQYLAGKHVKGQWSDLWLEKPFTRYVEAGFEPEIYTWNGVHVDINTWTWKDHVEQVIKPHKLWWYLYTESNFSQ